MNNVFPLRPKEEHKEKTIEAVKETTYKELGDKGYNSRSFLQDFIWVCSIGLNIGFIIGIFVFL